MIQAPHALPPRLHRQRAADGLDPAGPPPGLAWLSRTTHHLGDGQFRISVPCVLAGDIGDGVHAPLTAELRRAWVERPRRSRSWQITGIVAAFASSTTGATELTLAFTTTGDDVPSAGDDAEMHADLARILDDVLTITPRLQTSGRSPR